MRNECSPPPGFAEISPEATATPSPHIRRAEPFEVPGQRGPKTLLFRAAEGSADIRSLFFRKPPAEETVKALNRQDEENAKKTEEDERLKQQDPEQRRQPEASDSIDTSASLDTIKTKRTGFRGTHGSRTCPGINCPPHAVRTIIHDDRIRASSPQPCAGRWARHRLLCFRKWTRPTATRPGESSERASHRRSG